MSTIKHVFAKLDASFMGALSHGTTLREKKRWCDEVICYAYKFLSCTALGTVSVFLSVLSALWCGHARPRRQWLW